MYDYHPASQTVYETYIKPRQHYQHHNHGRNAVQYQNDRIPESTLWTYIFQVASALKAVHEAGLPMRVLDASKILVTGKNR